MMKVSPSILMALVACVSTAPTPGSTVVSTGTVEGDEPNVTHLYVCNDSAFKGQCDNFQINTGNCYNVPDNFNDKISSAGPDKGTFCTLYSDYDCKGKALPFTYPGIRDMERYGFGDVLSSYRCDFIAGWSGS